MKRNKFAGVCAVCGCRVDANTGLVSQAPGEWVVRHEHCVQAKGESYVLRVSAPRWVAELQVRDGRVAGASQMVCHMHGWTVAAVEERCAKEGWRCKKLEATDK